ncbi:MAG: hypothetical protein U0746_00440 [Gemmataceae bacterium]
MPDWLTESNPTLYFLLAVAALAFVAAWNRSRQRKFAVGATISLALLAGAYLCHQLVESDREQMERKIHEIAHAVHDRQMDQAFRHVSDSFERKGKDRSTFLSFAKQMQSSGRVDDFVVWAFEPGPISRESKRGDLGFMFKVHGNFGEMPPLFAKCTFVLDKDGEWRIQNFDVYQTMVDSRQPFPIPGW